MSDQTGATAAPKQRITPDELALMQLRAETAATYDEHHWVGRDSRALIAEVRELRAELDARIAAESADAAAGSYAGRAEEAEAARDAVQAEATLLRRALIGRRTFPAGVMRTPMDERTEAIRARWDEFRFSGPSETDRERDQVIGWLLDRMDSATARAERAEAALAEFEHEVQWAHQVNSLDGMWDGDAVVQADEQAAHRSAAIVGRMVDRDQYRVDVVCRDVWTRATDWRPVATPRTALECAADEQGVRCGPECSEGHTYEPGSCEAAIDPDEAIARNHADAKRDWGIAEQGDGEGGGDE